MKASMTKSKSNVFLYPKINCPFCSFYTTQSGSLGDHLVDKHTDKVVKGYKKVTKTKKQSNDNT